MVDKSDPTTAADCHVHKFYSLLKWIDLQDEKFLDLYTHQPWRDVVICNHFQTSVSSLGQHSVHWNSWYWKVSWDVVEEPHFSQ